MFQRNLEHVNGVGRGGCVGRAGGHFARTTCQDPLFRGCSMRAGLKAHVCLPGSASALLHLLPAGLSLTSCLPGLCFTSCLPGSASPPACRGSASPPACRAQPHLLPAGALLHLLPAGLSLTSCLPGLCFTSCLPGSASPPACRGSASPPACRGRRLDGADRQPLAPRLPGQPLHAAEPSKHAHACQSGTSCRSEKNPPLTHGDPAEAGPPGQSQPSRVHPVKQQAGAMRTRTGARPSSSSCARPVARICAYLPTGSGGGRHPQTRLTSPPPCGIAREKPPKWRSATPARIPPLPPPARWLSRSLVAQPLTAPQLDRAQASVPTPARTRRVPRQPRIHQAVPWARSWRPLDPSSESVRTGSTKLRRYCMDGLSLHCPNRDHDP
jgi:hypothetical protein